jgi:hypothetical protein
MTDVDARAHAALRHAQPLPRLALRALEHANAKVPLHLSAESAQAIPAPPGADAPAAAMPAADANAAAGAPLHAEPLNEYNSPLPVAGLHCERVALARQGPEVRAPGGEPLCGNVVGVVEA